MARVLPSVAQLLTWVDAVALQYDAVAAAQAASLAKAQALQNRITAAATANGENDTPVYFYDSTSKLIANSSAQSYFGGQYRQFIEQLDSLARALGTPVNAAITGVDGFATYYNGLVAYQCLLPWEFAQVYYWAKGAQISPLNVYCPGGPVNAGYTYTTGGGVVVADPTGFQLGHGAISGGVSTISLDNGGMVPAVNSLVSVYTQGYSPVIPELVVGTTFVGTGTVVLTFTGLNQAGVSKTWTATVVTGGTGLASGAVVTLTPQTGGDRMRSVSSVATAGTVTVGAWTLRVKQEAGRPA